jgi:hypothetical protein
MAKKRKPPKKRDRLAQQLVEAALAFHRCRPWEGIPAESVFLIQVPTEDQPLGAAVLGVAGNEFGLILFRGETALHDLLDMGGWEDSGSEELFDRTSLLSVAFEPPGAVPPEFREILDGAGFVPVRGQVAPSIFSKPAGRRARPPNRTEMRTLIFALRGVAKAYGSGDLQPLAPMGPMAKIHTLVVTGSPEDPEIVTKESMVPDLATVDVGEPPGDLMDETRDHRVQGGGRESPR